MGDLAEKTASTSAMGAWILPVSANACVAVGRYELKHIEYIKNCITLPGLPAFCEQGFLWHDQFIPALDVHSLVTRRRMSSGEGEQMAAIVAYEDSSGELSVGAILLRGVPKLVKVNAEQSIAVSELASEWQLLAAAAFKDEQSSYPVLDLRGLFDRTPADLLAMH